jgi:adenylosuccinate lyase
MIERYTCGHIKALWSNEYKYQMWRVVEIEVAKAQAGLGIIPDFVPKKLADYKAPNERQVEKFELELKHDVLAFLAAWRDNMRDKDSRRWVHYGLTSSDIVDTAQALIIRAATVHILDSSTKATKLLRDHALDHWDTKRIGRTHGQAAEPTTWGYRVADFVFALDRASARIADATNKATVAHISGPLGNYAHTPPEVEKQVAEILRLQIPESATQVVMRDRLGEWAYSLAAFATVCEAFALEVRHSARSEVSEVFEGTTKGQKGSSSMPHKANPVTAEKICGLAKLARAYVMPITEGTALWHERDISHSSVERVAIGDLIAVTDHIAESMVTLIAGLVVDTENMQLNVTTEGSATTLLELVASGVDRDEAYKKVQAMAEFAPCPPARVEHTRKILESMFNDTPESPNLTE